MTPDRGGVLLLDKPAGLTSFGLVERVRRWSKIKKVGHTGTLDPFATGLLVVCLGRATRLAHYVTDWDKAYEGRIRLGEETDTDDATGRPVFYGDGEGVTRAQLEQTLGRFRGTIQQLPPQFSAKKKAGIPSYRRARRGEFVDLEPVTVRVDELAVLSMADGVVGFRARCSKGTYMRSLARDLGRDLGCGAHLLSLRRTGIGALRVEEAFSLQAVAGRRGLEVDELLWPVERVLASLDAIVLDHEWAERACHGRDVPGTAAFEPERPLRDGQCVRMMDEGGGFLAVGRVIAGPSGVVIHPELVWEVLVHPRDRGTAAASEPPVHLPGLGPRPEAEEERTIGMEDETCR